MEKSLANKEWDVWQKVVEELRKLKVEINNEELLNNLLREWAQRYHEWLKSLGK